MKVADLVRLKMIPVLSSTTCFQHNPSSFQIYQGIEMDDDFILPTPSTSSSHTHPLLYSLAILKNKVQQLQSLVGALVSPNIQQDPMVDTTIAAAGSLIQEVIFAASSLLNTFQQAINPSHQEEADSRITSSIVTPTTTIIDQDMSKDHIKSVSCDIVELDAADLLAKYTHYCQVCGKGFRRDANLRMHMRAHGDEYKSNEALSKRKCQVTEEAAPPPPRKYSCPEEGCRWNRRHVKFQPLKSMVCAKNHYRRSHCPKIYVCRRCGGKRFSVISDLRAHEKHCGDRPRWRCSCGTTFSRKDKIVGHVGLFPGHAPVRGDGGVAQFQMDGR